MKIATTTGDFSSYYRDNLDRIRGLHAAGFRYIDLDMYTFTPDHIYMNDGWRDSVKALKDEAEKLGMTFVQAHSQGGNPLSPDSDHVDFLIDATVRSIEICEMLGIKNTVVHSGFAKEMSKEEWFEKNRAFYRRLFGAMERCGVNVLIENSTAANMKERYFTNSGKDMVEFLRYVDHPLLHACWDTGHANCEGSQYDDIIALGSELYAIHYNDNHGKRDEHLIPYLGTLNHDEVINALTDIGYKGYFTLECCSSLIPKDYWLGGRRDFDRDTRLSEPPLFMKERTEALLYETAKYILSSYGLFEE